MEGEKRQDDSGQLFNTHTPRSKHLLNKQTLNPFSIIKKNKFDKF